MKRTFSLTFLLVICLIVTVIGKIKEIDLLFYTGIGFGSFLLLNLFIDIIKLTLKITFTSLLSMLINILSLVVLGIVAWNSIIPPFATYILSTFFSLFLVVSTLRKLGKHSSKHSLVNSIFISITNYKGKRDDRFLTIKDQGLNKILSKSIKHTRDN